MWGLPLTTRLMLYAIFVAAFLVFRPRAKSQAHGSAGWDKPARDLRHNPTEPMPPGAIFLGYDHKGFVVLPYRYAAQHGIIIGGSGTGKSRGYFLPNAAFAHKTSLVVTDPKGELWHYTSGFHEKAVRFAPTEPQASDSFNWIPLCTDARIAELCARAIVESGNTARTEQAWIDLETAFLSALFAHTTTLEEPTPLTAYRLFTRQPQEALIEQLLSSRSEVAQEQANIFQQTSERMRGNIVPVVAAKLQFLRDPAIARFTSATDVAPNFGALRRYPHALYWCMKEVDIIRLRPLTSLFYSLLLTQLADAEISEDESFVPVVMLLDEFANCGVIPHFETIISLARGRGLSLWLGIQSLSQLEARYGQANAQTILTNCATKIALCGLDVKTAEFISHSLGEETIVTKRKARQHRRLAFLLPTATTHSETEHKRFLLTADEVRRIRTDEAIIITGNRRPMLLPKFFYNEAPKTAFASSVGYARVLPLASLPIMPASKRLSEPPPLPQDLMYPVG